MTIEGVTVKAPPFAACTKSYAQVWERKRAAFQGGGAEICAPRELEPKVATFARQQKGVLKPTQPKILIPVVYLWAYLKKRY